MISAVTFDSLERNNDSVELTDLSQNKHYKTHMHDLTNVVDKATIDKIQMVSLPKLRALLIMYLSIF